MNTLLVVGSAPSFEDDLRRAQALRPFAAIMLVNGACTLVENADYVLAGHTEKAEMFAAERRNTFPNAGPWQLHATMHAKFLKDAMQTYPSVTHWHGHEMGVCATSASKAAKIGFALGFEEVVLCGCPMEGTGYAAGEAKVPQSGNTLRIGDGGVTRFMVDAKGQRMNVQDTRVINRYRENFRNLSQTEFKGRVFSMSGFTRACCGEPR